MTVRSFFRTVAAAAVLVAATGIAAKADPVPATAGVPFTLGIGDEAWLDAGAVRVVFDRVAEDSRCPTDVMCVWAGRVRVELVIETRMGGDALRADRVEVDTTGTEPVVSGYRFSIVSVKPLARRSTDPVPAAYSITFLADEAPAGK